MSLIRDAVQSFASDMGAGTLTLDVGCGLRPYEIFFPAGTYIGIDVPQSGRSEDGKKPDREFNGVDIPFEDNHFDAIICTEVLEHAIDPQGVLREMYRVLKPGGKLMLTVPFMWGLHELPYDFRRYTFEGIRREIVNSGFDVTRLEKLNAGLSALQMLISSETNNYLVNVMSLEAKRSFKFRIYYYLQMKLLRMLFFIWNRCLRFERVYIDNLVIAQK